MPLVWRETLRPSRPAPLAEVAARLAEGIRSRGVLGPPLAFGDRPGTATAEGPVVRFGGAPLGRLTSGTVVLSGSPEAVTAECSVGLPSGLPVLLGLTVAVVAFSAVRGVPLDGEVALALIWIVGGWYLFVRLSLRFRVLDLLKGATSGSPTPAV